MNSDELKIIFEDGDIVVCDKPSGVLSEGEGSMTSLLAERFGQIFCVHRLDRETSGLMVYARSSSAAASLSAQIRESLFEKEYLALIEGVPSQDVGSFEDMLFYDRTKNKSFVVRSGGKARKGVKHALLDYSVIEKKDDRALVRIKLHTGRTHQIRVQFASRGMPLVADRRYGAKPSEQRTFFLRSCSLSFYHPKTKEKISFEIL
ncbi:MAG: RluA family pseudouridine synthase [Clostridia bacterium]|nr:RluA family pseudouridine synthase [Clostridia bacterium]